MSLHFLLGVACNRVCFFSRSLSEAALALPVTFKVFATTRSSSSHSHITMGNLIWHEWSRFVSLTASICTYLQISMQPGFADSWFPDAVWAGYWGIFYRKFFWDFVGGTLRDPGGMQYVYSPVLCRA